MTYTRKIIRNRASDGKLTIQIDTASDDLFGTRWSLVRKYIGKNDNKGIWYLHQAILGADARRVTFIDGDIFNYSRENLKAGSEGNVDCVGFSRVNNLWWSFAKRYTGYRFCGLFPSQDAAESARREYLSWYSGREKVNKGD